MWIVGLLLLTFASLSDVAHGEQPAIVVSAAEDRVELANLSQKLSFIRDADGRFILSTFVRSNGEWSPMFGGGRPLVQGVDSDLHPTGYKVLENSPTRGVVELLGRHPTHDYDWTLRCEAKAETGLIALRLICHLAKPLILQGLEPR